MQKKPTITVFTPAYNRAYIIKALYDSLCRQTDEDFEWLVVNDGSSDNTEELIQEFIRENKITIRYFSQENSGKHIAINKGVTEAEGELFFIVDSDDYLTDDAVETLKKLYSEIKDDERYAGVSGTRITPKGKRIGGDLPFETKDCSIIEFSCIHGYAGDMAEAYKITVLRQFPFPHIEGERFCPESLVWNRIGQKYQLHYANKGIYVCEYLTDGLTASIVRIRMKSPKLATLFYTEQIKLDIPFKIKIRAAINYWRFSFCTKLPLSEGIRNLGWAWLPSIIPGFLLYLNDQRKNS